MTTWTLIRTAGIGAYLMLFLSVTWGLAATTGPLGKRVSKASAATLHQAMSTVALVLLGVHLAGLVADAFMPFSLAELTLPFASEYRPVAVTFGIVAMYVTLFVIGASWLRSKIGMSRWRRTHLLAVPAFILALVHGVFAGSDTDQPWMWWTYLGTGLIVVFLLLVRGLTAGYRPERAAPVRRAASAQAGADTAAAQAGADTPSVAAASVPADA
jgi:predicted ferric reductase